MSLPLEFLIFKWQYPFPNFRGDSASYIGAAMANVDASEWPVGYSKFLRIVHFISQTDTFLVIIQYLLLELSGLFFILTLYYFMSPGKIVFGVLFSFIIFNPLFLHLGNYIMSDALFISLSLFWITQLIWIIYRPSAIQIFSHAILLFFLFSVRYNAMYYPLISIVAFAVSNQGWPTKIAAIALSAVLILSFIIHTENKFYKLNGVRQFSPFGGWQLANNALYTYQNFALVEPEKVPSQFQSLDSVVRQSFVTARKEGLRLNPYIKDYYIWDPRSPLAIYMRSRWKGDTITDMFIKWVSMGPLYSAYGSYLIRQHPRTFFQAFVWPNISNFFSPSIADLYYYNQGTYRIDYRDTIWFHYKSLSITPPAGGIYEMKILTPYPFILKIFNLTFLMSILLYFLFKGFKILGKALCRTITVIAGFWLVNLGFSSFASSIELRYQVFQFILCFSFSIILLELLIKLSNKNTATLTSHDVQTGT